MSDPHPPKKITGSFLVGLIAGGMIGFTVCAVLMSTGGYFLWKKKVADARKRLEPRAGGRRVPGHPRGTVVTFDMISQRSVPEQFVTSSVVKPDSASYIVNQKVLVPLQAGDLLLWTSSRP